MSDRAPLGGWPLDPAFIGPRPRCTCGYHPQACAAIGGHAERIEDRKQARLTFEEEA